MQQIKFMPIVQCQFVPNKTRYLKRIRVVSTTRHLLFLFNRKRFNKNKKVPYYWNRLKLQNNLIVQLFPLQSEYYSTFLLEHIDSKRKIEQTEMDTNYIHKRGSSDLNENYEGRCFLRSVMEQKRKQRNDQNRFWNYVFEVKSDDFQIIRLNRGGGIGRLEADTQSKRLWVMEVMEKWQRLTTIRQRNMW